MAPKGPRLIRSSFLATQPSLYVPESEEGGKRRGGHKGLFAFFRRKSSNVILRVPQRTHVLVSLTQLQRPTSRGWAQ